MKINLWQSGSLLLFPEERHQLFVDEQSEVSIIIIIITITITITIIMKYLLSANR